MTSTITKFEHTWLNFCEFILIEKWFKNGPHTLLELRGRIVEEVNAIPRHICNDAVQIFG